MGIKAKKLNMLPVERRVVRYESRWLRRLLRQHRRFARWMRKQRLPLDPMNRNYTEPVQGGKGTVNRKDVYNTVTGRLAQ